MIPLYVAGGGGGTWLAPVCPAYLVNSLDMSGACLGKCVLSSRGVIITISANWLSISGDDGSSTTKLSSLPSDVVLCPCLDWHHDHEPLMLVSAWTLYKVLQCSQHIISFMAHGQTGRGIIVSCKASKSDILFCFVSATFIGQTSDWSAKCRIVSLSPAAEEKLEYNLLCWQMLRCQSAS